MYKVFADYSQSHVSYENFVKSLPKDIKFDFLKFIGVILNKIPLNPIKEDDVLKANEYLQKKLDIIILARDSKLGESVHK